MTTAQTTELTGLYNDYLSKKSAYETLVAQQNTYFASQSNPNPASVTYANAQKAAAASAMETAYSAYNLRKSDIEAQVQAEFIAANPQVSVQLAEVAAQAQVNTVQAQAQAAAQIAATTGATELKRTAAETEAEAATAKRKVILWIVGGVAAVIIIIGAIWAFKKFGKKAE